MKKLILFLCAALCVAPATWAQFTRGNDFSTNELAAFADLNGDGRADIVDANTIRLNNGDGTFGPDIRVVPAGQHTIAVLDFNGDGRPDLLTATTIQSYPPSIIAPAQPQSQFDVYANNGQGTFTHAGSILASGQAYVGDFDGDGKDDVLVVLSNLENGTKTGARFFRSNGNGTFTQSDEQTYPGSSLPPVADSGLGLHVAIGDLNGDGHPDVVLRSDDSFVFLLGRGDGTFDMKKRYAPRPLGGAGLQIADLDGDGHGDLVLLSSVGLTVLYGSGDLHFSRTATFTQPAGSLGLPRNYTLGHFLSSKPEIAYLAPSGNLLIISGETGTLKQKAIYATGLTNGNVHHAAFRTAGTDDLYITGQPSQATWESQVLLSPPHAATVGANVPLRRHRAMQVIDRQQFAVSITGECASLFEHWSVSREGFFADELSGGLGRTVDIGYFDGSYYFRVTPDGTVPGVPTVESGMFTDLGNHHFAGNGFGTDDCGNRVVYQMTIN